MSYSEDYRKRTIEYRQAGHTLEETRETFKVSRSTIERWEKNLASHIGSKIILTHSWTILSNIVGIPSGLRLPLLLGM